MGALIQIGTYVVETLAFLYLLIVMLRFLFQLVKADFYNPISQFVVKATNPLLIPLRRFIPGIFGIDVASLVLALLLQWATMQILAYFFGFGFINPLYAITWASIGVLSMAVNIFFWAIIIMVIASWIAPQSYNPALLLIRQLIEPIMAPFRKLIPPMGGLDISPIFAILAINVVKILVTHFASAAYVPENLVLGI